MLGWPFLPRWCWRKLAFTSLFLASMATRSVRVSSRDIRRKLSRRMVSGQPAWLKIASRRKKSSCELGGSQWVPSQL